MMMIDDDKNLLLCAVRNALYLVFSIDPVDGIEIVFRKNRQSLSNFA